MTMNNQCRGYQSTSRLISLLCTSRHDCQPVCSKHHPAVQPCIATRIMSMVVLDCFTTEQCRRRTTPEGVMSAFCGWRLACWTCSYIDTVVMTAWQRREGMSCPRDRRLHGAVRLIPSLSVMYARQRV